MKKKNEKFDPDRLVLSKNDILDFCDKVIKNGVKTQKNTQITSLQ